MYSCRDVSIGEYQAGPPSFDTLTSEYHAPPSSTMAMSLRRTSDGFASAPNSGHHSRRSGEYGPAPPAESLRRSGSRSGSGSDYGGEYAPAPPADPLAAFDTQLNEYTRAPAAENVPAGYVKAPSTQHSFGTMDRLFPEE